MKRLLLVVVFVLFAGCTGFLPGDSGTSDLPEGVGEVGNVTYQTELDIDPNDGFTEAELNRFVNRTMARIEVVRRLDYERSVDVEVVSRAEYREQYNDRVQGATSPTWENQIWRALFIVGQNRDVNDELDTAYGESVLGFYEPGKDSIVIVSDSEQPVIDKRTLVHELTHALQDQQFGLAFGQDTRDEQAAYDTLVEGEAVLVADLYLDRCGGEWSCVRPETEIADNENLDPGIYQIIIQPYNQGVGFVEELRADGGWEAVADAHEEPPVSTAQTTNPDRYPDDTPRNVTIPDRSSEAWNRFDQHPTGDTLGTVSIFTMFATNDVIPFGERGSYSHPVSAGWDGDRIVPYRNGDEFGYVWEIAWQSEDDATEFADAYRELLEEHGGLARGRQSYVIDDGPYAGAYRLQVSGDTVRIVNGPTLSALSEIHSS